MTHRPNTITHTREYRARGGTVYIYYFRSFYEAKPSAPLTQNSGDATGPQRYPHFWDPYTYAITVRPMATKFGMITHVGEWHVSRGLATPCQGVESQRPPNFGTCYMRAHSMRNNNQILHGDQTKC